MINVEQHGVDRKLYLPPNPKFVLVLAHGAGAGFRHEFMEQLSQHIAELGGLVWSFNFPYMRTAYETEKKRPPNRLPALIEHFGKELGLASLKYGEDLPIYIAGKSMGGRVASVLATDDTLKELIKGVIIYGYPFIPPGKPEKFQQRTEHFDDITKPMLILQGERDPFGDRALLDNSNFGLYIKIKWVKSGEHSFKPLKKSGLDQITNIIFAAENTASFIALREQNHE